MTTDNDLTRPLGVARERRGVSGRLALAGVAAVVVAALAGAGVYAWLAHGPLLQLPAESAPAGVVTVTPVDRTIETGSTAGEDAYSGLVEVRPDGALTDVAGDGKVIIHDPSTPGVMELAALPEPDLVEPGPDGPLPAISPSGLRPLDAYARPFASQGRADRIAIVIGGVGINAQSTTSAIRDLPGVITLALAPYGEHLDTTVARARGTGHELLMQVPMEPFNYPSNDPGPQTLVAAAGAAENLANLRWILSRATTYVGVTNYLGARFTNDDDAMKPIIEEIGRRGLLYVDDGSSPRSAAPDVARGVTPVVRADVVLDAELSADAIDRRLEQLQAIARERGYALATGTAFPITIERVAAFARAAERRGIEIVPVSALALSGRG